MKKLSKIIILLFVVSLFPFEVGAADLSASLKGRILLQVEENGEAWYINPANQKRYFLGRPADAFGIMRELGVGITNANLEKIPFGDVSLLTGPDDDLDGLTNLIEDAIGTDKNNGDTDRDGYSDKDEIINGYNPNGASKLNFDTNFAKSQAGKILLQVEQNGEAWYVSPVDNKKYYLGRPADAFGVMRGLGLGITNENLATIDIIGVAAQEPFEYKKFASEKEFKDFIEQAQESQTFFAREMAVPEAVALDETSSNVELWGAPATESQMTKSQADTAERYSETNVQVAGIDEPDIIKTDGENIYYSYFENFYYFWSRPLIEPVFIEDSVETEESAAIDGSEAGWPPEPEYSTSIIKALPVSDIELRSQIDKAGQLLLAGDILIIFTSDQKNIYGYDISEEDEPVKSWEIELEDNIYVKESRLYNNEIYLVTNKYFNQSKPCPFNVLSGDAELSVACSDIYYPTKSVSADQTYTIMKLSPETGDITESTTFVGSSDSSVVYMSTNAIYLGYSYDNDYVNIFYNFMIANQSLFPQWLLDEIKELTSYDISSYSKYYELGQKLEEWQDSLDDDEAARVQNELNNKIDDYFSEHKRELSETGIVKLNLDDLVIEAKGIIPGSLLNQFSMDEYDNILRAAVNVGAGDTSMSANDVYTLDSNLDIIGSVKDLGETERIYSVRFVGDKGYVVTFRQIDPFYVLDLSDPKNPEMKGELKIPGFSSYLHPISDDLVLGIGEEDWEVKVSLFDVSDPNNPVEASKYLLDDYWSEIESTHHAFLLDAKHEIFFVPGSEGGYIFSYKDNELILEKVVSDIMAQRALYINDYLYIAGENKIIVLDEITWEQINEIELTN